MHPERATLLILDDGLNHRIENIQIDLFPVETDDVEQIGSRRAVTLDLYSHIIGTLQEDAATRLDLAFGPAIRRLSMAPNLSMAPKKAQ